MFTKSLYKPSVRPYISVYISYIYENCKGDLATLHLPYVTQAVPARHSAFIFSESILFEFLDFSAPNICKNCLFCFLRINLQILF